MYSQIVLVGDCILEGKWKATVSLQYYKHSTIVKTAK